MKTKVLQEMFEKYGSENVLVTTTKGVVGKLIRIEQRQPMWRGGFNQSWAVLKVDDSTKDVHISHCKSAEKIS